ncbi:MAG: hypothetical protein IPI67_27480 [Myxococcales bacterium]|nr:hypothetical protein [Myxococcales bacterium]
MRRWSRTAILAVLLGATLTLLSSCSSLLGFDDYSDSADDLCDLAEKCYDFSTCKNLVGPRLDTASADARAEWLSQIPGKNCLESCSKSRKCLNADPVCGSVFTACDREEECCGFLGGTARCQQLANASTSPGVDSDAGAPGQKVCCRPDGVQTPDANSCCSGIYNPKNQACGKNVCRPALEDCTDDLQCCSQFCRDGKCAEDQCLPLGTPCSSADNDRCCDGADCLATTGTCEFPQACREAFKPCRSTDPPGTCCAGTECKPAVNKHPTTEQYDSLCLPTDNPCMPKGYGCADTACCTGLECRLGECRAQCNAVDQACGDNGDCCSGKCVVGDQGPVCACAQIYCEKDPDCCDGICIGGVCTAACAKSSACHDECIPGPPLLKTQSCPNVDPTCVAKVCAQDAYCCCVEWDATCVKEAVDVNNCGVAACN